MSTGDTPQLQSVAGTKLDRTLREELKLPLTGKLDQKQLARYKKRAGEIGFAQ